MYESLSYHFHIIHHYISHWHSMSRPSCAVNPLRWLFCACLGTAFLAALLTPRAARRHAAAPAVPRRNIGSAALAAEELGASVPALVTGGWWGRTPRVGPTKAGPAAGAMPSVGEDMTSVVEASCNFGPKEAMVQRHQGLQRLEKDGKTMETYRFWFCNSSNTKYVTALYKHPSYPSWNAMSLTFALQIPSDLQRFHHSWPLGQGTCSHKGPLQLQASGHISANPRIPGGQIHHHPGHRIRQAHWEMLM